jgi:ubiquinone biosynthesis monooxygenase Coq7
MPKPYFKNREDLLTRIIRVNYAGEYGAVRIYKGQIDGSDFGMRPLLMHMLSQEERHLEFFRDQTIKRKIRPTILLPLWHITGYLLGFITSYCSANTAMLCTQAVEEVIDKHYSSQIQELKAYDGEQLLIRKIEEYRLEELEHRDIALQNGSLSSPLYNILHTSIKAMCRVAIVLSKRI